MLTSEQIALIRQSAEQMALADPTVTSLFYVSLFTAAPSVRSLFPKDMFAQSDKLWASVLAVIDSLDNLDAMRPALVEMGRRHVGYGAKIAHYEVVKTVLLDTLASFLGPHWTPAHNAAWDSALSFVVAEMQQGHHAAAS